MRLRALVADRMLQLVAQEGGSDAKLVLLLRQLAAKLTRMKPAGHQQPSCSAPVAVLGKGCHPFTPEGVFGWVDPFFGMIIVDDKHVLDSA